MGQQEVEVGNGLSHTRVYPSRPDIAVRNTMKKELGYMPSKEQVSKRMAQMGISNVIKPSKPVKRGRGRPAAAAKEKRQGEKWLTINQAAKLKSCHPSTINNWVTAKKITARKVRDNGSKGFHHEVLASSLDKLPLRKMASKQKAKSQLKQARLKQAALKGEQTNNGFNTEIDPISYLYGHCETFISIYARGVGLSEAALARGVAERILASTGG